MRYRDNALEGTVREEYESARAVLEELADNKVNFGNERLTSTLEVMGFEKKPLDSRGLITYVREKEGYTEVLSEYSLDKILFALPQDPDKKLSLYQIPVGQEVQEWYDSIPQRVWEYKSDIGDKGTTERGALKIVSGVLLGYVAVASGVIAAYSQDPTIGAVLAAFALCGSVIIIRNHLKYLPKYNELKFSGPKAIQYIKNTPFEDVLEYNRPRLRIEETPIIDAEFSDVEAEQEMEVAEEAERMRR
ncbi:MAG: hypothetical protein AABX64_01690 [Nanoarchaeota archaeon]